MEIIKDNVHSSVVDTKRAVECEECGSLLKVSYDDISFGEYGLGYFKCPCCGNKSFVDGVEIDLTPDNVRFPKHYWHVDHDRAQHIEDEEINRMVSQLVAYLADNNDEEAFAMTGCGDALVFAKHGEDDNEIDIMVAKDFYETTVRYK